MQGKKAETEGDVAQRPSFREIESIKKNSVILNGHLLGLGLFDF